jgi:peroxiredoxin family protein
MTNPEEMFPASVLQAIGGKPFKNKLSMVVLSGDLDKVMAAFIIATGAAASGMEVTMFFTFWGMKAIQKDGIMTGKSLFGRMLGMMNRGGLKAIGPSRLNMGGMGRWMFKLMMNQKGRIGYYHDAMPDEYGSNGIRPEGRFQTQRNRAGWCG